MKEDALTGIEAKLDTMITLLGLLAINNSDFPNNNNQEKICLLSKIGLDKYQIAKILCTTPDTVRVQLARFKKKSSKQSKKETIEETKNE